MVYNVPNSALEYDAIFRDHEFPLWNRYVSTGLPLFSQGQSMLGNPLHFLAIAANGASWAWDLKFLIAKALFCFGIGLCLWSLTHRLSVSALLGASSAWIGFFAYRFNHPAFFSLCFAPWVLLPWLISLRGAPSRSPADPSLNSHRPILVAMLGLLLADWCELTSGTAKEACMILIFMNAAGLLIVASHPADGLFRFRTLGIMIGASLCFFLLSAPHWLPFLDALKHGLSWYDAPLVYQLSPGFLIGLFDDIFSQDFTPLEAHTHPSANFLVLLGFLWLIAGGCRKDKHPAALGLLYVSILLVAFCLRSHPSCLDQGHAVPWEYLSHSKYVRRSTPHSSTPPLRNRPQRMPRPDRHSSMVAYLSADAHRFGVPPRPLLWIYSSFASTSAAIPRIRTTLAQLLFPRLQFRPALRLSPLSLRLMLDPSVLSRRRNSHSRCLSLFPALSTLHVRAHTVRRLCNDSARRCGSLCPFSGARAHSSHFG